MYKRQDKAERLEDLINEFFEITRFNLSEISLEYHKIDLIRLLEQLVFEFKPMLSGKNLTCTLHTPESLPLHCDPDKIQRVFDNLLRNAVLYSYKNSNIDITARVQEEQVIVTFQNQGDAIPPEKLARIFEQFYRLDTARKMCIRDRHMYTFHQAVNPLVVVVPFEPAVHIQRHTAITVDAFYFAVQTDDLFQQAGIFFF